MKTVTIFVLLFLNVQAMANNYFIPNHYRGRRSVNTFTAIAWSDRHEVGAQAKHETEVSDRGGVKDGDNTNNTISPYIYENFGNGLKFEAQGVSGKSETTYVGDSDQYNSNSGTILASIGVEVPNHPIALSLGFGRSKSDYSGSSTGETSTNRFNFTTLGAGYQILSNYYLGVGYIDMKYDAEYISSGTPYTNDSDLHMLFLGGGVVFGEHNNPWATTELVLSQYNDNDQKKQELVWHGLMNIDEYQFYAEAEYGKGAKSLAGSNYSVTLGMDYQFTNFFVGPELGYDVEKYDDDSSGDSTELKYSLLAGYRTATIEVQLGLSSSVYKSAHEDVSLNLKRRNTALNAGFAYFF